MEQILLAYGFPKENLTIIMMLYKNMKVMACSPDGDIDFCDIIGGLLQRDTFATYNFIISQDYIL